MLYQHDTTRPIGCWHILIPDQYGLYGAKLTKKSQMGNMLLNLYKNIINGLSIGYHVYQAHYSSNGHRIIEKIDLKEISLVTFQYKKCTYIY